MTTINVRVEEKLKKDAKKTLASLGLDTSSAIKMFLTQVVREKGLPFRPTQDPQALRAEWDKEVARALKDGKGYTDVKEFINDLRDGK